MNTQPSNVIMLMPNPRELDRNSPVFIYEWVELNSERHQSLDDDPKLTYKWFQMLTKEPAYIRLDFFGRAWCINSDGKWTPYHFDKNGKNYGIKVSKKAAN